MLLKKNIFFLFIILLLLFILYILFFNNKKELKKNDKVEQKELIIPTVDNNVKVSLEKIRNGEIKIIVYNASLNTENIDFEISYLVKNTDLEEGNENEMISQGVLGKCYLEKDKWYCGTGLGTDKKIVLGTCSSGVCRYHNIVGPIKLNLKFSGSYGIRIFEKDYQL